MSGSVYPFEDWERAAFAKHELEQHRETAAWPFSDKLLWLEEAETMVLEMQRLNPRTPYKESASPSPSAE